MHYHEKISGAQIRTHDLWIRKRVCYPLHHSASHGIPNMDTTHACCPLCNAFVNSGNSPTSYGPGGTDTCSFPFTYNGQLYYTCVFAASTTPCTAWCPLSTTRVLAVCNEPGYGNMFSLNVQVYKMLHNFKHITFTQLRTNKPKGKQDTGTYISTYTVMACLDQFRHTNKRVQVHC